MHGSNNIIICNSDATFSQKENLSTTYSRKFIEYVLCLAPASNPNIRFKLTQGVIHMLFSLQALLQFIAKGDPEHIHLSSGGS
jgi:hypothetical protein